MCEVFAWVCFAISVQTLAVFIFIAAGTAQMCIWAQGKHKRLRKVGVASSQAPWPQLNQIIACSPAAGFQILLDMQIVA